MTLRLAADLVRKVDAWAKREGAASRSDAIRRLIEQSLSSSPPPQKRSKKSESKAREMAGRTLDRLSDQSIPDVERAKRKRRLTKGPTEFREIRDDVPTPKR
jgi:metal-responsive CopG/Arc/MetJ family transcriptional regulator